MKARIPPWSESSVVGCFAFSPQGGFGILALLAILVRASRNARNQMAEDESPLIEFD